MDEMLDNWNEQYDIHTNIMEYKTAANNLSTDESEEFDLIFHENYLQFLEEVSNAVKKLKKNISEI